MDIIVHSYSPESGAVATIDGTRWNGITPGNWRWEFIQEWEAAGNTLPPFIPAVPEIAAITRRQARLGLLSIGITAEAVEAHIAAIADPIDRAAALIEWQDATSYERTHPLVADLAAAFDLPTEQVDALWLWAAGL